MTEKLIYCKATTDADGQLAINYRWEGSVVAGSVGHDEDVSEWDDDDVIELIVDLVGIKDGSDVDLIELERW